MQRLLISVLSLIVLTSSTTAAPPIETRTLDVAAKAVVYVVPDKTEISLSVTVFNADLSAARSEHDDRVQRVLSVAKEVGVLPAEMQTTSTQVDIVYEQDNCNRPRLDQRKGFRMSKTIGLTLRDASKLDALITRAIDAGVTEIESVSFECADLVPHRDAAYRNAVRRARAKAELLASELGQKLGKPLRVREVASEYDDYYGGGQLFQGGMGGGGSAGAESIGSAFALGQIEVSTTVTVQFELDS